MFFIMDCKVYKVTDLLDILRQTCDLIKLAMT